MIQAQGLNLYELKEFKESCIKANSIQIVFMFKHLAQELKKRNVYQGTEIPDLIEPKMSRLR